MGSSKNYARNLISSWLGYGTNLLVLFFLSPFVIQSLGDVRYGIWTLMVSLTGYMSLAELGLQAGLGRFINVYMGRNDHKAVNGILSTGLTIFLALGPLLILGGLALAFFLPSIFRTIPSELTLASQIVCVLSAWNLWLTLLQAPFRIIVQALERFELTNAVDVVALLIRSIASVIVLTAGYGLIALAVVQLVSNIAALAVLFWISRETYSQLHASPKLASRAHLSSISTFSIWAFIGSIGYRIISFSDAILIGIFLGPKWVAIYSIGDLLVQKTSDFVNKGLFVFRPRIMQYCGIGKTTCIRSEYVKSLRLGYLVASITVIGTIFFGNDFILLWLGDNFAESYPILMLLMLGYFISIPYSASLPIFSGLNRVKTSATLTLAQATANVLLSVLFVVYFDMGLIGIALGTIIPRFLCCSLGTVLASRLIAASTKELLGSLIGFTPLVALFSICCLGCSIAIPETTWGYFLVQLMIATVAYGILAWVFVAEREEKAAFLAKLKLFRIGSQTQS